MKDPKPAENRTPVIQPAFHTGIVVLAHIG